MGLFKKECPQSPSGKHQFTHHTYTHEEDGEKHKTRVIYCHWCGRTPSGKKWKA